MGFIIGRRYYPGTRALCFLSEIGWRLSRYNQRCYFVHGELSDWAWQRVKEAMEGIKVKYGEEVTGDMQDG